MFYFRNEGERIRQGFNIYPLKSDHIGFKLVLGKFHLQVRYSKVVKEWFINTRVIK